MLQGEGRDRCLLPPRLTRLCVPQVTHCDLSTQYQTAAATAKTNEKCAPLTVCTSVQFTSVAATSTSDRKCSAVTGCNTNGEMRYKYMGVGNANRYDAANGCAALSYEGRTSGLATIDNAAQFNALMASNAPNGVQAWINVNQLGDNGLGVWVNSAPGTGATSPAGE